jgi:hypothetical protein
MKQLIIYLFWPNPGGWDYGDSKVIALTIACLALILSSFLLRFWRGRMKNPQTKSLSKMWPSAALWFGLLGLVLIVCRVEFIQFLAMRFLWVLLLGIAALFVILQFVQFRRRHYTVLGRTQVKDEREKYLPRKK